MPVIKAPVLNINDLTLEEIKTGDLYQEKYANISEQIGAKQLSYSVTIVPPNKISCPFHVHHINEEMFLILEGTGLLRFGDKEYPLKAGDVIACPIGGKESAHQIINNSQNDLKYFCLSTNQEADICEYPDSGKFGVFSIFDEPKSSKKRRIRYLGRTQNTLDYWDGEKTEK